jgi:hypothetical protein
MGGKGFGIIRAFLEVGGILCSKNVFFFLLLLFFLFNFFIQTSADFLFHSLFYLNIIEVLFSARKKIIIIKIGHCATVYFTYSRANLLEKKKSSIAIMNLLTTLFNRKGKWFIIAKFDYYKEFFVSSRICRI